MRYYYVKEKRCVKCPSSTQTEPKGKPKTGNKPKELVVISTLETPPHVLGDTSLPVLHSATSEDGEGRPIGTNETHTLGLNNSVDDDRIPNMNR